MPIIDNPNYKRCPAGERSEQIPKTPTPSRTRSAGKEWCTWVQSASTACWHPTRSRAMTLPASTSSAGPIPSRRNGCSPGPRGRPSSPVPSRASPALIRSGTLICNNMWITVLLVPFSRRSGWVLMRPLSRRWVTCRECPVFG